jgi:hypothetical protein
MGRHDDAIARLKADNKRDDQEASRLADRLRDSTLKPDEIVRTAQKMAALDDAIEARANEIARLEKENRG